MTDKKQSATEKEKKSGPSVGLIIGIIIVVIAVIAAGVFMLSDGNSADGPSNLPEDEPPATLPEDSPENLPE